MPFSGLVGNLSGNLRSSIGYVVFKDGKPVNIAFEAVKGGHVGVHEGQRLAQQIGENYTDGYTLVVVAGMNYAVHVESKGRCSYEKIRVDNCHTSCLFRFARTTFFRAKFPATAQ